MAHDIVGLGLSVIDLVGVGPAYPEEDTKVRLSACDWQAGGSAATGLVAASRLGASCSFLGHLGLDYFGQRILDSLKAEQIDTTHVRVYHDVMSQYAFSYTSEATGSRTMFINFNQHWNTYQLDDATRAEIAQAKVLLLDRHETHAGIEALKIANEHGIPSVFDPSNKLSDEVDALLRLVTHPVLPETFLQQHMSGKDPVEGAREVLALGSQAVVVTQGKKGCLLVTQDQVEEFPAFEVPVVDTLGAGDVFHGAFAFGLMQAWSLAEVCIFASAVAALKCKHIGGRKGIPRMEEVALFLADRGYNFVNR